jgi:hypothetical protein
MATAGELHAEVILRNKGKPYDIWKAIEAQHLQRDASLRHEAWMQLLALRKKVDETYVDFYRRVESAYARVHRITPKDQTAEQRGQELTLFTVRSGLLHDGPLRRSLTAQRSLTLDDAFSAFLRTDAGDQAHAESANAASSGGRCVLCNSPEHLARDCHHREAINQLVARRNGNYTGSDRRRKPRGTSSSSSGGSTQANASLASGPETKRRHHAHRSRVESKKTLRVLKAVSHHIRSCAKATKPNIFVAHPDSGASNHMTHKKELFDPGSFETLTKPIPISLGDDSEIRDRKGNALPHVQSLLETDSVTSIYRRRMFQMPTPRSHSERMPMQYSAVPTRKFLDRCTHNDGVGSTKK